MLNSLLHLDQGIAQLIAHYGPTTYFIMFLILFLQTGVVLAPFLPGDGLLLAAGIFATPEKHALSLSILIPVLLAGPILGNLFNYKAGRLFGQKMSTRKKSRFWDPKHLEKTHAYFEKYGTKTIIIGCWIPFVRTFAPFVAGASDMSFPKFCLYSAIGSTIWVLGCVFAGYFFGNLPIVKNHFDEAILGMMILLATPLIIESIMEWRQHKASKNKA